MNMSSNRGGREEREREGRLGEGGDVRGDVLRRGGVEARGVLKERGVWRGGSGVRDWKPEDASEAAQRTAAAAAFGLFDIGLSAVPFLCGDSMHLNCEAGPFG